MWDNNVWVDAISNKKTDLTPSVREQFHELFACVFHPKWYLCPISKFKRPKKESCLLWLAYCCGQYVMLLSWCQSVLRWMGHEGMVSMLATTVSGQRCLWGAEVMNSKWGYWSNWPIIGIYPVNSLRLSDSFICVCKLTIVGSDNSLSPGQHQAII